MANSCDLFSMTGDFQDPFVENWDELFNSYATTLRNCVMTLPVHFGEMLKYACDLAEYEQAIGDNKSYFVLVLVIGGIIDDRE